MKERKKEKTLAHHYQPPNTAHACLLKSQLLSLFICNGDVLSKNKSHSIQSSSQGPSEHFLLAKVNSVLSQGNL